MEYLKNVLYKFITLPPCDEKKHLLPVMDTMLKFDPKEKATLQAMAAGEIYISFFSHNMNSNY